MRSLPEGRPLHVLLIEDNVDAAESLAEVLELSGHHVSIAATGPDGLEKARALVPDVVLCDIGLPGMDGYAVARAIRADETLRSTYIIALSGYALPEDVEKARQAGFALHLAKPPDLGRLEKVLEQAPVSR
jgi:two-component system CheB/CheR fusion protein